MATIGGTAIKTVNDSYRIEWKPNFTWLERSNRNWIQAEARGNHKHFCTFSVRGTYTQMVDLITAFQIARGDFIVITWDSGEYPCGPGIEPATESLIIEYPEEVRAGYNYWALDNIKIMLRGASLHDVGQTLTPMRLARTEYKGTSDFNITNQITIDSGQFDNTVIDHGADGGYFKARFWNDDADYAKIRTKIIELGGGVVTMPPLQGITYPWGSRGSTYGGNCRIKSLSNETRADLGWFYDVEFVREK